MRRSAWSCASGGLTVAALLLASSPASACSLASDPAFADVREGARTIFAGRILAIRDVDGAPDPVTIDVTEVFKGHVPADPFTRAFVITGCGDDLGYLADVGDEVIIATGYLDHGERVDPAWVLREDGRVRATTVEGGGRTYAALAAGLRGGLPPTDAADGPTPDASAAALALIGILGASAWTLYGARRAPWLRTGGAGG